MAKLLAAKNPNEFVKWDLLLGGHYPCSALKEGDVSSHNESLLISDSRRHLLCVM